LQGTERGKRKVKNGERRRMIGLGEIGEKEEEEWIEKLSNSLTPPALTYYAY